jgi:hypothetical protein
MKFESSGARIEAAPGDPRGEHFCDSHELLYGTMGPSLATLRRETSEPDQTTGGGPRLSIQQGSLGRDFLR